MSWANFKPEIWSKTVLKERDTKCIAVQNSWRQFEGDIRDVGDHVHIQGVKGAPIRDYDPAAKIGDPDLLEDESLELLIDQKKYVNFGVKDIDRYQMNVQVMASVQAKTANDLAKTQDAFLYGLIRQAGAKAIGGSSTAVTKDSVIPLLTRAVAWLNSNNVDTGEVFLEVHPFVFQKLQLAYVMQALPNATALTNGYRGDFLGVHIYESNTIPFDDGAGNAVAVDDPGAVFYNVIRTRQAVAFAEQKSMNYEAYRPQNDFMDAIKGFNLYGGKVIKPQELALITCKVDMTQN